MHKLLFTLALVLAATLGQARNLTLEFSTDEGNVHLYPRAFDGHYSLVISLDSPLFGSLMNAQPELRLKFSDGRTLHLIGQPLLLYPEGMEITAAEKQHNPNNLNSRRQVTAAQFTLTLEQVKQLSKGIDRIQLNTQPTVLYYETKKKQNFGKRLFDLFQEGIRDDKF